MTSATDTGAADTEALPRVFGRYLLIDRISRGGMGEIFLARHGLAGFEKIAVIKKIRPGLAADEGFASRFEDEAQLAVNLQHANIAQVYEVGRRGKEFFLALEYIEGRDLRRTLQKLDKVGGRLPKDLALFIAREVLSGLAYAHRRTDRSGDLLDIVHCDISPPNVMLSFEGEIKLIDFGIARSALKATATDPKMGWGKFGYMSPEQLVAGQDIDHRTDLYAAGVLLFEMLTGKRMYPAGDPPDYKELARRVTQGDHPVPSDIDSQLGEFDPIVSRALRPRRSERYQSAAEFRDDVQRELVRVSPTISGDDLGLFVRHLFADERIAWQKRLDALLASSEDIQWQQRLHDDAEPTVTFAMGERFASEGGTPRPKPARREAVVVADTTEVSELPRQRFMLPAVLAAVVVGVGLVLALILLFAGRRRPAPEPVAVEPIVTELPDDEAASRAVDAGPVSPPSPGEN